jgi:hypothetical protein
MLKILTLLFLLTGYFGFNNPLQAQSFGFGCLGLVGGYAGYSHQTYIPAGLNDYILVYNGIRSDSLVSPVSSFGQARGFRVGLNLFRANFDGLILTAKGYYQFISEKSGSRIESSYGVTSGELELRIKTWGAGFDLGTSVTKSLSWKVIDAALLFSNADLINTQNFPNAVTEVLKYGSETSLGYSIGTGFILSLIDQYVTLEGLIAYSVIKIDQVTQEDGTPLTINENSTEPMNNFIETGGFNAVIQLNIGLPL